MKVIAFAATNNSKSINAQLVRYATSQISEPNLEIEFLDINDYELPLFSEDRENLLGQPRLAKDFLDKIAASDAVVISFAEHNGSYTVAYKNIFDWASRINQKVFQNKPMVMLATSPGSGGASSVLASAVSSAPFFDGEVKSSLSIPSFHTNFDSEKQRIIDNDLNQQLISAVNVLFNDSLTEVKQAI